MYFKWRLGVVVEENQHGESERLISRLDIKH